MALIKNFTRLIRIQRVLVSYGLDELSDKTGFLKPLKYLFFMFPGKVNKDIPIGKRIRKALEELGPIFIKFGQAISTRRDLLPNEIADELTKLQDQVPPFEKKLALEMLANTYDKPLEEIFSRIDEKPLAAASIAQVHSACLTDGTEVIVKILRPNVKNIIQRDIEVLHILARLVNKYWEESPQIKPIEIVKEYEKTILNELDLKREAANSTKLKKNFKNSKMLYVPEIYWKLCHSNILVQERIYGTSIRDIDILKSHNTNFKVLAENGVEIFFTQVFRHNFFHADMHPGNIFVQLDDPDNPVYAAVDFGIVGTLTEDDQYYLAENFLAFFEEDYKKIAQLHIDSGWVPGTTRVDELEIAVRTVCEPIFNKPLSEISFATVLISLFDTARQFNMEIQPQLILLQKTLFNIEGLGRQLYPELDLWKTAYPVLKEWMGEQIGPRAILKDFRDNLPLMRQAARNFPKILKHLSEKASKSDHTELYWIELKKQITYQVRKQFFIGLGVTSMLASLLIYFLSVHSWVSYSMLLTSIICFIKGRPE